MRDDVHVVPRPDWWRPGLPLPPLQAMRCYTGSGQLNSGGKVTTTVTPVRWETPAEREARLARKEAND